MKAAAGSVLALALLACSPAGDRGAARPNTAIISVRIGAEALNPSEDTWSKFLVFLPLLTVTETGELEGRLARNWAHSPDYKEWTYHLRTDVRWHDGVPVTARDVKFTLDLLSHPDVLYFSPGYIESVTVVDDSTVTIRSVDFGLEWASWAVFYPEHLLRHLDPASIFSWDFWTRTVGNGPYRFVRYLPQTMMEFEANPDYFRGKPKIENVVLKFDPGGRLTELLSGNVDAIATANPSETPAIAQDPRFRVHHAPDGTVRVLYWRNDHPILRDPRVRRALTLAIDRGELQQVLGIPGTIPVVDGVLPAEDLVRGRAPPPLPYDPGRAAALLEEAGWTDRDGDGLRERDRSPLRFTLLVRGGSRGGGTGVWQRAAVFVQAQLRRVGVDVEIEGLDAAIVRERLRAGAFEAALEFGNPGADWLRQTVGKDSYLRYRSDRVEELVSLLSQTARPDDRHRIYRELIEVFQAEAPVTFLGPILWTSFAHRRLRGLSTPFRANPLRFMEDLWLEDAR